MITYQVEARQHGHLLAASSAASSDDDDSRYTSTVRPSAPRVTTDYVMLWLLSTGKELTIRLVGTGRVADRGFIDYRNKRSK